MTRLLVFRHGETDWNAEERFQGHLDIPLNEKGRSQAAALGKKLRGSGVEALLTSDLSRSIETARIVASQIGLPPERLFSHVGIKEAHLGEAQGLTTKEIRDRFGATLVARWRSSMSEDADVSYPGGETGTQVLARASQAIAEFVLKHPSFSTIGISTHGGVIRRLLHWISGGHLHAAISNGALHELHFNADEWPDPKSFQASFQSSSK